METDYRTFHDVVVPAVRAKAEAYRQEHGVWEHALGRTGAELAEDGRRGRLWQHKGATFALVGRSLPQAYYKFGQGSQAEPPATIQWQAGLRPWKVSIDASRLHEFLRELYAKHLQGGAYASTHFTGMLQKPSTDRPDGGLYPFFLELDEEVADLEQLGRNDAWLETHVGPLLEAVWPGRWWGWVRPTELRACGRFERAPDGVRSWIKQAGWKGGVHVHVDAWVTPATARRVYDWIASMLGDQDAYFERGERRLVGPVAGVTLDPITHNRTGLRLNGAYKSKACSPYLHAQARGEREATCPSGCRDCHGMSEMLTGPPYWPTRADTFWTFRRCSVAPPAERTEPTPLPAWLGEARTFVHETARFRALRPSDRAGFEAREAIEAYFRRTGENGWHLRADPGRTWPLDVHAFRPAKGAGCVIAKYLGLTACWFRSDMEMQLRRAKGVAKARRVPVWHGSGGNLNYFVFLATGRVKLRCMSGKRDCCRHCREGQQPAWTGDRELKPLADEEGRAIFGPDWAPDRLAAKAKPSIPAEELRMEDLFMGG